MSAKAAFGFLSDIGMGLFGNYQQKKAEARQFEYNKKLANLQWDRADKAAGVNYDFQERMSSTAYQRAMADMRAGGLNPILAYKQGGASSPSGGMPSYASPGSVNTRGDAGIKAASASAAIRNMREQNLNLAESRDLIKAQADRTRAEAEMIRLAEPRRRVTNSVFDWLDEMAGGRPGEKVGEGVSSVMQFLGRVGRSAGRFLFPSRAELDHRGEQASARAEASRRERNRESVTRSYNRWRAREIAREERRRRWEADRGSHGGSTR